MSWYHCTYWDIACYTLNWGTDRENMVKCILYRQIPPVNQHSTTALSNCQLIIRILEYSFVLFYIYRNESKNIQPNKNLILVWSCLSEQLIPWGSLLTITRLLMSKYPSCSHYTLLLNFCISFQEIEWSFLADPSNELRSVGS